MMQVGTNQSTTYHSQPSIPTSGGQTGRSSSASRQQPQQQSQYDNEQLANIRPRICTLRKWPHYDGYGVHLARNQHWLGLRIGDVEPNSPAESGGLLREDVVLSVNGHSVENDDFFVILSFIQHELENDQIRFLVLDPHTADLARRQHLNIDENYRTCVRMETPTLTVSPEKVLYDQWRATNNIDPAKAQNTINLGPTTPLNPNQLNANIRQYQQPPQNGREDVYTFLPYSDHALENGKTYFEVLFDQDGDLSSTQKQQIQEKSKPPIQYSSDKDFTGDKGDLSLTQPQKQQQQPPPQPPQNTTQYPPNQNFTGVSGDLSSTQQQKQKQQQPQPQPQPQPPPPPPQNTTQYPSNKDFTGVNEDDDFDFDETDEHKEKKRGSSIKEDVKSFVKSGLENIKSVLPTRHHDDTDKNDGPDSKRKASSGSLEKDHADADPVSLMEKLKSKLKGSSSPPHATEDRNTAQPSPPPIPHGDDWQKSRDKDASNSSRPEPRMCSLTLRPGETMGISVSPDKDFGHIIKSVDSNSPADRAGIERDDCILSINDTSLLNIPYDEVLNTLRESRHDPNLDFLVAKKSYLLKSSQNDASLLNVQPDRSGRYADTPVNFQPDRQGRYDDTPVTTRRGIADRYTDTPVNAAAEVLPSSNLNERNNSSAVPASQTLEQLFNKYTTQQKSFDDDLNTDRPRETVSTSTTNERYDRLSPHSDDDQYPSKPQQGQILQGVGPATGDRSSWGVSSGKSTDDFPAPISGDSSLRSNARGRRTDADDTNGRSSSYEESFKPLQVGITNPTQQSNNNFADDGHRTSRPTSFDEQRETSPKALPSPGTAATNARGDTSSSRDYEPENDHNAPIKPDTRLGPTKVVSAPSKPVRATQSMAVYADTDDDDLSDISERSREEDISEPIVNKNGQSIDDKKDKTYSELSRGPVTGIFTPYQTTNSTDKNSILNEKRTLGSTMSDADKQIIVGSTTSTIKTVVPARRLEQSDSDDATSGTDSLAAKQSAAESFYSPDESLNGGSDTDDQQPKLRGQHGQPPVNLVKSSDNKQDESLSQFSNQQQTPNIIHDQDDASSNESSTTESDYPRMPAGIMAMASMPLSELEDYGYELHNIQLMQPTETSPVGLKLSNQHDPLQYIITNVAKGTKADLAGLRINDWLIQVEDNDIRQVEFQKVSHEIRQLLTNAGLINMVIARKKSPTSTPAPKQIKQQQTPSSSKIDSIGRQQGGQIPAVMLTTDITRDTPDNNQVRFTPDESTSPSTVRSQISNRETANATAPGGPLSVGLTNRISGENLSKSPRSQSRSTSRSPTREYALNQQQKEPLTEEPLEDIDPNDIRHIVLKEALGLDFNSFIPESDSELQTHFISNVQPSSMADKAGLRDGDRILTVNGVDVTNSIHEDVRRMMQNKKPLQLTVVNDPKYVELIENVKQNQNKTEGTPEKTRSPPPDYESVEQDKSSSLRDTNNRAHPPIKSVSSESSGDSVNLRQKSESPKSTNDELSKYLSVLFTDDKGPVQAKHCILKKDPSYNGYGLLLRYQNGLHLIDQVEEVSPAHNSGLREDDVILYVDRKNVEQMTHDDVKILIRKLSLSNTNIDLILIKKNDVPRYKKYQENNSIDWKPILQDKLNETKQTEQQESSNTRSSNDQTSASNRFSSASSAKQQAPAPPTSSTAQPSSSAGTRVCTLLPSAERTAGFALSGKAPPPYIICQIEANSPAEKAGLHVDDVLLSINGKPVTETSYEDTVKLVKEALQQKSVELVVRDRPSSQPKDNTQSQDRTKMSTQPSKTDQPKVSTGSRDSSNLGNNDSFGDADPRNQGTNAVEEYQKQRNKELSYTLRLCHLHPTNGDGTQAATFGFELSEEPDYEYPLILRVEPHSSAEGAGLQSRDILLKINDRKTKGLGYDKVKKEIEKAKRDGRLEMLVVDQETYDYCKRAKKPLKEPEMKVKHVFPKSRSSASFHKLPIIAASSLASRDSVEQLSHSITKYDDNNPSHHRTSVGYHLSTSRETDSENEEDKEQSLSEQKTSSITPSQAKTAHHSQPVVNFDLAPPATAQAKASDHPQESPLKFLDRSQTASQQVDTSSTRKSSTPSKAQSTTSLSQTSTKESKGSRAKSIPNAINNLIHRIGHSKSSKPDYDAPPKATTSSKTRAPSPPTVRVGHNRFEAPRVSQSLDTVATNATTVPVSSIQDTARSTISTGSFDYLRGPRRCVLKVDRNKGLGFVLSATGDYDHTITAVEKYSAADIAGLQVNDEILEVDGADVRSVKYEQVVEMLVSAMRINDTIEMRVIDGRSRDAYPSTTNADNQINSNSLLNSNNNNNTITASSIHSQRTTAVSGDDLSDINSSISPFDSLNQQKITTSYPNLPGQLRQLDRITNRALSGSVPALATGITASPSIIHQTKSISNSSEKGSVTKLSDISTQEAPVGRLCRVRKFATSPFYGFFLCGDPKKLGRVFISDVTKHSPAAVCGLRDGDRIIEINGSSIDTLTYETILDKIKQHMASDDLELLVLDKKSVHWYRERNYTVTSRTLPTIVHIEPIINDTTSETQPLEVPTTHTKMVGFADRRVSKTGL